VTLTASWTFSNFVFSHGYLAATHQIVEQGGELSGLTDRRNRFWDICAAAQSVLAQLSAGTASQTFWDA